MDERLVSKDNSKFRRRFKEQTKDAFVEFQRLRSESEFEILRNDAKICKLLKLMHFNGLDQAAYPFVDPPKLSKKEKQKAEKKQAKGARDYSSMGFESTEDSESFLENPRLFVFVFGGLSHHEICSIAELQKTLSAQIVPGSNEILTPTEFLTQLEELHKVNMKEWASSQ
mmetsp:Transcript_2080/g.3134  ORF Transcript_2080/g.3134 Transcript_2080/m.3134 type:complete len:170 (-) Transcript_2080:16-525(-)